MCACVCICVGCFSKYYIYIYWRMRKMYLSRVLFCLCLIANTMFWYGDKWKFSFSYVGVTVYRFNRLHLRCGFCFSIIIQNNFTTVLVKHNIIEEKEENQSFHKIEFSFKWAVNWDFQFSRFSSCTTIGLWSYRKNQ